MLMRYEPTTSWADLDEGLGQTTTLFPPTLHSQRPKDPYEAARELGITLPPPPTGGDQDQQEGWTALCYLQIIDVRLRRTHAAILRLYQKTGVFVCRELLRYNNTAFRMMRGQQAALDILRSNGWGVQATAPTPPLFHNLQGCKSLDSHVRLQSPLNPGGVQVSMGCGDASTAPAGLNDAGTTLIIAGIFAAAGVVASWLWAREYAAQKPAAAKEVTQQTAVEAEWQQKRAELIEKNTDVCIAKGGDPIECVDTWAAALPEDLKALDGKWIADLFGEGGKGWLWWIGAATVGIVAIGGAVWFFRRRRGGETVVVTQEPRYVPQRAGARWER